MKEFKPIKPEKLIISIRIDTDMLKNIDKISSNAEISRNELIVQCINYALKNIEK